MDLAIHLLPAGAGNLLSTDRIPYDRDLGGGNWVTEYHTGTQIINAITGLPTASFTNINSSITNAINTAVAQVDTNFNIIGRGVFAGGSYTSGTSHSIDSIDNLNSFFVQADRVYTLKVRIYAYRVSGLAAVRCQEYNISICTDSSIGSPFIEILGGGGNTDFLFDHYNTNGAAITLNPSGFSITSGGKLRFNVSHGIGGGAFVSFLGHFDLIV
jgi:hypothetical protein